MRFYPRACFVKVKYIDDDKIYIYSNRGNKIRVDIYIMMELYKADGTRPLNLPDKTLSRLEKHNMIETGRFTEAGPYRGLMLIPLKVTPGFEKICGVLNYIFPIVAVMLFIAGICIKCTAPVVFFEMTNIPLYIMLTYMSLAVHEFGHFVTAAAYRKYGIKPYAAGVLMVFKFLPAGAFVSISDTDAKLNRRQLALFNLSGVQMNILIAGISLMLSTLPGLSGTFTALANTNVLLALVNLIPAQGLDGEGFISAVLGVDSIFDISKGVFCDRAKMRKLFAEGLVTGVIKSGLLGVVYISKYIIIALNVILILRPFIFI